MPVRPPPAARRLALALLVVAGGLALPPAEAEDAEAKEAGAEQAAPTRLLAITAATSRPTVPFKGFDGNPPKLFDFDGDGDLEIVAQNDNHWVYVFDSRTGAVLAELTTALPPGWTPRTFNGPEVAVLEPGGDPRLVVANSAAVLTSFRYDPEASSPGRLSFAKEWDRRLDDCHEGSGMDSKPVLADLDRDGRLEIVASTEDSGLFALRADGEPLWTACITGGNAEPVVADLDLDGWPEVVFGSDVGVVTALEGRTGAVEWEYQVLDDYDLGSGSFPVGMAVGQLDGKGGPDLLVGARDSHDPADWAKDHALLLALDSEGRRLWGWQDPDGAPLTYTHPVLADADGDGETEVYWADWNTVGHFPPRGPDEWKRTGPAHVYRLTASGQLVWRQTLDAWWNNKDVVLADTDGDAEPELLANGPGPSGGHDGLWALDVRTGAKERFIDAYPWKISRAPVAADLYGSGSTQLVLEVGGQVAAAGGPGLLIYETGGRLGPARGAERGVAAPAAGLPGDPLHLGAGIESAKDGPWWGRLGPGSRGLVDTIADNLSGSTAVDLDPTHWGVWARGVRLPFR